jgi:hypothetical protein
MRLGRLVTAQVSREIGLNLEPGIAVTPWGPVPVAAAVPIPYRDPSDMDAEPRGAGPGPLSLRGAGPLICTRVEFSVLALQPLVVAGGGSKR